MYYSDDPERDFRRYDAEQERIRQRLPVCSVCNRPIEDDRCWVFCDDPICDECAVQHYRKDVSDLMEW